MSPGGVYIACVGADGGGTGGPTGGKLGIARVPPIVGGSPAPAVIASGCPFCQVSARPHSPQNCSPGVTSPVQSG
jgi:hypothetical protein